MEANESYQEYQKSGIEIPLHRRDFFRILGGGLYVFFQIGNPFEVLSAEAEKRRSLPNYYNAFLRIAGNCEITCMVGKIEMGYGIIMSLAQMIADELDVQFGKVKMIMGDTDLCPWDGGTHGLLSTRAFSPYMRRAAAEARGFLLEMAAEKLGAEVNQLSIKNGVISVKNNPDKKVSYGELAKGQKIDRYLDEKSEFKDYSELKLIGKPLHHTGALEKVTGKAKFTADIHLPGMLYAKVFRPPSHRATLTDVDTSEAEKLDGIQVLKDRDFIAVLHEYPEKADQTILKGRRNFQK